MDETGVALDAVFLRRLLARGAGASDYAAAFEFENLLEVLDAAA